jgi:non-lysosomal glucosylceramidase
VSGTSRRDFVKVGLAASLVGVVPPAEEKTTGAAAAERNAGVGGSGDTAAAGLEPGFPRVHSGRQLTRISRPLGGIATGGIGLGGRGNLQDWQIFNRPDIGNTPEYAFSGMWVKGASAQPYSVVLERRILPPYDLQQEGLGSANVPGLPRLAEAKFIGSFPTSRIEFLDTECPVGVALDAFSPFYPLDVDGSGLPCAILTYEIRNPAATDMEVAVAWSLTNPVGQSGNRTSETRRASGMTGLFMSDPSLSSDDPMKGSFVLAVLPAQGAEAEVLPRWHGGSIWHVGAQHFWFDTFARDGRLGAVSEPSAPVGSVLLRTVIPAGEIRSFRFLLAWHFPNRTPERCGWDAPAGQKNALLGNYYCTQHADAWAVAEFVSANLPALERNTRNFVDALQRTTLPTAVKEAASANLSTLVSNTSFRIADGSFQGFEGCADTHGLGFGTCTHVWNYEVATQFLFPALARSMRETNFGYATDGEGHMDFRHKLPLGQEHWGAAAADGQMGQIVKLYFDWVLSGDDDWLRRHFPAAKRALEYAWRPGGWDERKSGVMDGVQHTTYDIELFGPNPMCGSWYLAALQATAQMADAMGDPELARECRKMAEAGRRWMDAHLFNGEYYVQQIRGIPADKIADGLREGMGTKDTMHPQFQIGDGCLVDQLVGQYMATVAGLGDLLDADHIRATLTSIYRYNYKRNLSRHPSVQRVYALNDEAALVICDYTKGTRPDIPMPYYAEIMTGFEYSASVLMLANGMVDEGVECIGNIRRRYDGEKANPYDETEYGRHYARPMASWAAIPVLSGFRYDAREKSLELTLRMPVTAFVSFWSTPTAWGLFELSPDRLALSPLFGKLALRKLTISPALQIASDAIRAALRDRTAEVMTAHGRTVLQFTSDATIDVDHHLVIG